jgi:hypothetical protein
MKAQRSSINDKTKLTILLVFLGIGLLLLIGLLVFLLGGNIPLQPSATLQPVPAISTLTIPTVDCSPPTLVLGATSYQIENVSLSADGTISVAPDVNGTAYWVEGTGPQYIFMLSPTVENLNLLTSLPEGISATATWSNCNSTTFTLSAPQPGDLEITYLREQSAASILIFLQLDPTGEGFMISGEMTGEQISTFNTPDISRDEVQAEIGLVETEASADGNSIQLTISIYNFGGTILSLADSDVSLIPSGAEPLVMSASEPALPREIAPAVTETFTFTFPRPATPTATLRVFTVEYDIEGY